MIILVNIFFFFTVFIFLLSNLFSLNFIKYKLKTGVFERGFDSLTIIQISFSLNFFYIILIFVIFDLELILFLRFLLFFKLYLIFFIYLIIFIFITLILE